MRERGKREGGVGEGEGGRERESVCERERERDGFIVILLSCRYVRCLGAVYLRLVGETLEVYNYLEPLYNDYRKLKRKNRQGGNTN